MAKCTVVSNAKGGVGKTVVASVAAEVQRSLAKGKLPKLLDCDGKRKLSKLYKGQTIEIDAGPSINDVLDDPDAIISHWDVIGQHILTTQGQTDVVVDLGANLNSHVMQWAERSSVAEEIGDLEMIFIAPTTADVLALEGAVEALDMAATVFPAARRVVVFNEGHLKFEAVKYDDNYLKLKAMTDATQITMPKCVSKIWPHLEQNHVSFARAIENKKTWFVQILCDNPDNPLVANRAYGDMTSWAKTTLAQFIPLYQS